MRAAVVGRFRSCLVHVESGSGTGYELSSAGSTADTTSTTVRAAQVAVRVSLLHRVQAVATVVGDRTVREPVLERHRSPVVDFQNGLRTHIAGIWHLSRPNAEAQFIGTRIIRDVCQVGRFAPVRPPDSPVNDDLIPVESHRRRTCLCAGLSPDNTNVVSFTLGIHTHPPWMFPRYRTHRRSSQQALSNNRDHRMQELVALHIHPRHGR